MKELWVKFEKAGVVTAFVLSVISIVTSIGSLIYSRQQAHAALEANSRASGRVSAQLVFEGSIPDGTSLPEELRHPIFDSPYTTFYSKNPEELIRLNPRIVLRNAGEEPVEAIRVTVSYDFGRSASDDYFLIGSGPPGPIVTEQLHREEHLLDQKLGHNDVCIIPITKGLIHQMLQGQQGQIANAQRYGEFSIRCSGRVVGGTSFDPLADDMLLKFRLLWLPEGFPENKCTKLVRDIQPKLTIIKY